MTHYSLIFINDLLTKSFSATLALSLCPFFNVSKKIEHAVAIGLATTCVTTITSIFVWLINKWILVPLNLTFLRILILVLTIAFVVQFTEAILQKTSHLLYRLLGVFLPLITTNCIVLNVVLTNTSFMYNFLQSVFYGFFSGVSFLLTIVLFSSIRIRLSTIDIPIPFRGNAISLITAGLMSLSFTGFSYLFK